ncbi:hypothetical protein DFS34DRAFT_255703 [Phlyctochytrium arcticum]|nr:hypothetical protein DFS34DRAFT_672979 [Phlyctochytrium arcticum]KAI9093147.1 hypothetical protein DFS34DRAFT_696797 [Phlyctochytrium arcticum]KAI9094145.1 hypothetical protein DFS34DRAFT_255703 [Phlyctochytrium arcticum]
MSFNKRKLIAESSAEQYYTSKDVIDDLIEKELVPLLRQKNITHYIDSSAGDGYVVFRLKQILPEIHYVSYDLFPATDTYSDVIHMDFLQTKKSPTMRRVAVGFNPPYGAGCFTSIKFVRHAAIEYKPELIAMILPHRATVARYDGMKLACRKHIAEKSFFKFGTGKVFNYAAFWSVFEKGVQPIVPKLEQCAPNMKVIAIHKFKVDNYGNISQNIILIGRYYVDFRWYWVRKPEDYLSVPSHIEYIALYLENDVEMQQVNRIVEKVRKYREDVVFYKRSIAIQDVVKALLVE